MTHPTDQPLPLPVSADVVDLPTVARLYYGGSSTRRYRRASTLPGPGEPLMFASTAREYMRRRDAMWSAHVAAERERWAAELSRLRADNENLRSVMIAAAEEILEHWDAHCDADGYGPANLMHRLEAGIPSEYGYKAGDFARLRAEVEELRQRFRTYSFGQVVRLSDPEMKATVDAIKRRIKEEPGFGKALLQSAGILDAKGGFAEMYADAALTNRND